MKSTITNSATARIWTIANPDGSSIAGTSPVNPYDTPAVTFGVA